MDSKKLQQKIMGTRFFKGLKKTMDDILDICFPAQNNCIVCKVEDFVGLCPVCFGKIKRVANNTNEQKIISYGYYRGVLKDLILRLKYKKDFLAARILGDMLIELLKDEIHYIDIIYFIPLTRKSIKKRGYNQCEILAEIVSEKFNIPFSNNLIKIKDTKEQKLLSKSERNINLVDSFTVKNVNELLNKNILLIDDVYTTGATLREAEKVLINNGACTIKILTVCQSII